MSDVTLWMTVFVLVVVGIGLLVLYKFTYNPSSKNYYDQAKNVAQKYDPEMSALRAYLEMKAAIERREANIALTNEIISIEARQRTEWEAAFLPVRLKMEHDLIEARQQTALAFQNNMTKALGVATELGVRLEFLENAVMTLIQSAGGEMIKKGVMDFLDRLHQEKLAANQIRMGLISSNLEEHSAIGILLEDLKNYRNELDFFKSTSLEGNDLREQLIADWSGMIFTLEQDIRERQTRLLQVHRGENS